MSKSNRKPRYRIELIVEEANIKSVEAKLQKHFGSEAAASARKVELSQSRADRLSEVESAVEDGKAEVESLKDELQDWYDNLPESFQNGDKGNELQEAIDGLESIIDGLEQVDFSNVSFPGMY